MAETLARTDVESIRARHRIEDVVAASGVELRQVGRQLMGCCPFHDDHTASLSVGGVADRYHCFGCGAGGDVIDYIGRLHRVGFREAVAFLDGRQPPPTVTQRPEPAPEKRPTYDIDAERAWQINALAWAFYTRPVHHEFALAHTRRCRGLDLAPAEARLGHQLLGRAGNNWTALTRHLRDHGVTDTELTALDLAFPGRHGLVDAYRERLVVPVTDQHRHVTGFVGRDLSGRPRSPKYRNPTKTVVFDKSTMLYTPHQAIPEGGRIVVVEGPFDALAVTAAAASTGRSITAVSTCGTTVTPAQVAAILQRHPSQLTLALDGDPAGQTGTCRWVEAVCRDAGHPLHIAELPHGLDPADLVGRHGADALDFLDDARPALQQRPAPTAIRAGRDRSPGLDPPLTFTPPCWPGEAAPNNYPRRSRPL